MKNILEIRVLDNNNMWQKCTLPNNANVINGEGSASVAQKSYDSVNTEKYKAIASGVQSVAFGGYRYDYFKAYSVYQKASSTIDDWGGDFYFTATYYQNRDSETKSLTIYKRNSAGTVTHSLNVEPRDTADDPIEITIDSNVYTLRMLFSNDNEMTLFRMDNILFTIEEGQPTTEARGDQSAAFGGGNLADADFTFVAGKNNKVYQEGSVAFGGGNTAGKADGDRGTTVCAAVFGADSSATGNQSFAAGNRVHAVGDQSVAFGQSNRAEGTRSFVAGHNSKALGYAAVALGNGAIAESSGSFATGNESKAHGISSIAMGHYSEANTDYSIAAGYKANATGVSAIAIGSEAKANASYAISIGNNCQANGENSIALGKGSISNGIESFSAGGIASGLRSVSFGAGTKAEGNYAFAAGELCEAKGINSIAMGQSNLVDTDASFGIALGRGNKVYGILGIALGDDNRSISKYSFSVGYKNTSTLESAVAIGDQNSSTGKAAIAFGTKNNAEGTASVAIGNSNKATASSVAIGYGNKAPGYLSFAGGYYNSASGANSTVFGSSNESKGTRSTVFGFGNVTGTADQFVCGRFAVTQPDSSSDAVFVVGYGKEKKKTEFANALATIGYYCIYNGVKTQVTESNCDAIYTSVKEYYTNNNAFAVLRDGRAKVYADPIYNEDVVSLGYLNKTLSPQAAEIVASDYNALITNENGEVKSLAIQTVDGFKPWALVQTNGNGNIILPDPYLDQHPVTLKYFNEHIGNGGDSVSGEYVPIDALEHNDYMLSGSGVYATDGAGHAYRLPIQTLDVESLDDLAPYSIPQANEEGYFIFKDPVMDQNPVTLGYLRNNAAGAGQSITVRGAKNTQITYSIYYHSSLGIENIIEETSMFASAATPIERSGVVAIVIHSAQSYGTGGVDNPTISGMFLKDDGSINLNESINYTYGQVIVPLDNTTIWIA